MTEKFIPYTVNGRVFDIPESKSADFEAKYPDATIEMHVDDKIYDIPLVHKEGFLKKHSGSNVSYAFDKEEIANEEVNTPVQPAPTVEKTEDKEDKTGWGESLVKGLGSGAVTFGRGLFDAAHYLSTLQPYVDPETGEVKRPRSYDEQRRDKNSAITAASRQMGETAERLRKEADPTHGEKDFSELLAEGKIGQLLQKGLATAGESAIQTASYAIPGLAPLNFVSMAGSKYADETDANPDVDPLKRGVYAVGGAALEMAIEKITNPFGGNAAAKGLTKEMADKIIAESADKAVDNIAKRIFNALGRAGKKIAKSAGGEGLEEIGAGVGTDALGQALDWIDGDKDYGFSAQWEQLKEENPDANLWDFAKQKGKEYWNAFLGGALSGAHMSGVTTLAREGSKELADYAAHRELENYRDKGYELDYNNLYDVNDVVNENIDATLNVFANENGESSINREFVESLSSEDAFTLSRREDIPQEQRVAFANLAASKARQEGLNQKLTDRIENEITAQRILIEDASEGKDILKGTYNGKDVYVKGGRWDKGAVTLPNGNAGPVIIVDTKTGEKKTVPSSDITNAIFVDAESYANDLEQGYRELESQTREKARTTMSPLAKQKAVTEFKGKKIMVDLGNGIIEVGVRDILPKSGEVLIQGKKGDLGGQSFAKIGVGAFYDSLARDDDGNPMFGEGEVDMTEEVPVEPVVDAEVNGDEDYMEQTATILINGVPTEVEVTQQDNTSNTINYRYTDGNGITRSGNTTIGGFKAAIQQAEEYAQKPQPAPQPEPQPTNEPAPVENQVPAQTTETPVADTVVEEKPKERTSEDVITNLYSKGLDENEVNENIDAHVADAQKKLDTLKKKAPKMGVDEDAYIEAKRKYQEKMEEIQKELDFWTATKELITTKKEEVVEETPVKSTAFSSNVSNVDRLEIPKKPVIKRPRTIKGMSALDPMSPTELAARELSLKNGGIRLTKESFLHHTGYGASEANAFKGLFLSKEKGGMDIVKAGERLMEIDSEYNLGLLDQDDPNAGLDAILDALSENRTMGELRSYIARQRQAEAQREADALYSYEMEQYENLLDEAIRDEVFAEELTAGKAYTEEGYNELMTIFAEEIYDYETGDIERESDTVYETEDIGDLPPADGEAYGGIERSNQVLQETQPVQTTGEGDSQRGGANQEVFREDADSSVRNGESSAGETVSTLDEDMPDLENESGEEVVSKPVAPRQVADPIAEAQKKEKAIAPQLERTGIPHKQKQDMAFNAGKYVGDLFATYDEYEDYQAYATDFGEYNEDFERGVRESFKNRKNGSQSESIMSRRGSNNASNVPTHSLPIEDINEQFNYELQQQIDGTLPEGHVYYLGMPSDILRSTGIPMLPIQLSSTRLKEKSNHPRHSFDLSEVKDLVKAISEPMGVFVYGDKGKSQNIVVEIQHDGKNFIVGLFVSPTVNGNVLNVNSIRNVFPKDNAEWLNWIAQNKSLYLDKGKIQTLINQQRMNLADVDYLDLDSIAKIIENFENPSTDSSHLEAIDKTFRQNIAVDNLVGEAKHRTIQRVVNEEAAKLGVTVTYQTREEMPKGLENDKGYYNTKTGEVVICTENASSISDAIQTILHEAVAHKGLRQIMGDKFNEFINSVYNAINDETKAKVDKLAAEKYDGNKAVAMEEYMATLAESENFKEQTIWEKIKTIFNNIINSILGRDDIELGDNELRYLLRASYNNMVNPNEMMTLEGWAKDMMMREDYGINKINTVTPEYLSRTGIDPNEVAEATAKQVYDKQVSNMWQEFERQFQDFMQPVRIAMDAIQQETGNIPIEDYENYILIHNQSSSRSRIEIDKFVRRYYNPIINQTNKTIDKILKSRGFKLDDKAKRADVYKEVCQYMIAKHGLERNAYYQANKTKKVDGEEVPDLRDYSGLTALFGMKPEMFREAEAEAQKLVDRMEAEMGEETENLWKKINAATDKTLRHSYESGLLSRQQYNDIKSMFQYYIPLRGFDETTAEDVYSYARFEGNRFNPAAAKAEGRTSLADDPIATIMNMSESEIAQGNKNRAKQALYNFLLNRVQVDENGNEKQNSLMQIESVWYVKSVDNNANTIYTIAAPNHEIGETYEEFEKKMNAWAAEGKAEKSKKGQVDVGVRFQKQKNQNAHYIYLKINGVDKAIYVNGDPKAAEAINGTYKDKSRNAVDVARTANRLISSTFTNYSLEFTARNYFRDMAYSHIAIAVKEADPAYRKKFRQNWRRNNLGTMVKMLKAYRAGEYDNRPLTEDEAAFVEFLENGGQTGYTLINSVENHKRDLEIAIKNMRKGVEHGGLRDSTVFKYTLGAVELLNESSELITRFAAFKTSRDMGRSIVKSISDAKEITVNFNTKGAQDGKGFMGFAARYLGWSKYFFNASVQGVQNIKAMAQANKLKFGSVVGGIAAFGFMMPVLTAAIASMFGGDEDEYWNIPEYDRQNNFCVPLGNGMYAKIPLPIGFREVYALGDMLASMAFDKKFTRDAGQIGMDMANKIASIVLPINPLESSVNGLSIWQSLLYAIAPSSAQVIIQNATNIDWKGAPIQKEYTYNENDPNWMKAFASNPDWMVCLSKWCNENIGAGDMKGMDWSPEKLDNTLSSLLGGIYTVIKKTGRSFSMIWNEENRNLSNIPLSGVILGSGIDDDDSFVTDMYYEEKEYYDDRLNFITRRAKKFGYTLDDVFMKEKGKHHPKMQEVYSNKEFDFMQEWYRGNKELDKLNDKIKDLENEITAMDKPSNYKIEKLAKMKDKFAVERRDFVNDMLELD